MSLILAGSTSLDITFKFLRVYCNYKLTSSSYVRRRELPSVPGGRRSYSSLGDHYGGGWDEEQYPTYRTPYQRWVTELGHSHPSSKWYKLPYIGHNVRHTANALYRKFETNIPRNARPRLQFLHSCICIFIYSHNRSANAIQQNRWVDCGDIYKLLTDPWMQKLERRPRSFVSGNIASNFRCGVV